MQQADNTPTRITNDWPNDFDFRAEVAEQQELLEQGGTREEPGFPTHSFEYDF